MAATTTVLFLRLTVFAAGVLVSIAVANDSMCKNDSSWSSSNDSSQDFNRSSECTVMRDVIARSLIHGNCTQYLRDRCYLHTANGTDFTYISRTIDAIVDGVARFGDEGVRAKRCGDILLGIVCNSVYPGCNPDTGLPIGLCTDTCLAYMSDASCAPLYASILDTTLDENREAYVVDLEVYTNCNITNSFGMSHNQSDNANATCYGDLTGIDDIEHTIMPEVEALDQEMQGIGDRDVEANGGERVKELVLAYVLPSASAMCGAVVLIVVLLLATCYLRRLRKRSRCIGAATTLQNSHTDGAFPQLVGAEEVYSNRYSIPEGTSLQSSGDTSHDIERGVLPLTTSVNTSATTSSEASNVAETTDVFQLELSDFATVGEGAVIPFDLLTITGHLGEGAFGYVLKGLLKDVRDSGQEHHIPVAMKTLKSCASYSEMRDLLVESSLMHSFSHAHILSLCGISLDPGSGAPYLVMPFMENGDLRRFLRKKADLLDKRLSETTYPEGLDYELLAQMCCDVAEGMEYLAEKRLVHRDLAARNCMVDRSLRVKVADFGLTREIYEQDCYRQSSHGQLPIKWMSPESLAFRLSNEKTDVWSFGVTCWEVFSLGRVPYHTIENRDLLDYLENGHRLSKPRLCNQHIYDIMQLCWNMEPQERPTFSEIVRLLQTSSTPTHHHPLTHIITTPSTSPPQSTLLPDMERVSLASTIDSETESVSKYGMCINDEYVDMTSTGAREKEALILANGSIIASSSNTNTSTNPSPRYFAVTILDSSGEPVEMEPSQLVLETGSDSTDHHDSQSLLILTNTFATMSSESSPQDEETVKKSQTLGTIPKSDIKPQTAVVGENTPEGNGLLHSIIHYIREKITKSEESTEKDEFLALQMKELENSCKKDDLTMTSSLHHSHHTHPLRQSAAQQRTKFAPSVETVAEVPASPYQHVTIYDECPTTPHVTIAFKTGETVIPVDTIFSFSHKNSTAVGSRRCAINYNDRGGVATIRERDVVGVCVGEGEREVDNTDKKRCSVVSMPAPGGESSLGWRERMRERFSSYSAGDYVKMKPAPRKY